MGLLCGPASPEWGSLRGATEEMLQAADAGKPLSHRSDTRTCYNRTRHRAHEYAHSRHSLPILCGRPTRAPAGHQYVTLKKLLLYSMKAWASWMCLEAPFGWLGVMGLGTLHLWVSAD
ncbi:Hypothetical predicted protein [Pelobates cultripes]|uniref:Uncharacterized protein n=1 Tax=Pelobates cultripes TaxID=61616 RepID=A0AAD1RB40_PELCU|nr:Hypothetical predicted protein [Pelobates cultripes]